MTVLFTVMKSFWRLLEASGEVSIGDCSNKLYSYMAGASEMAVDRDRENEGYTFSPNSRVA
uniref:Uncharacterized protein n=1 Tax=Syphacia muris TaxID=451379 RepID=A0A0N5ACS9_9BILA